MTLARIVTLSILLAVAACADPTGPVLGDWRGQEPSQTQIYQTNLEIILDGAPDARAGTYHFIAQNQGALLGIDDRRLEWTDRWAMQPVVVAGRQMERVHLDHLAGPHEADFILTPEHVLVPQPNPAHPDLSAAAYRVALYPLPRASYGYGRP